MNPGPHFPQPHYIGPFIYSLKSSSEPKYLNDQSAMMSHSFLTYIMAWVSCIPITLHQPISWPTHLFFLTSSQSTFSPLHCSMKFHFLTMILPLQDLTSMFLSILKCEIFPLYQALIIHWGFCDPLSLLFEILSHLYGLAQTKRRLGEELSRGWILTPFAHSHPPLTCSTLCFSWVTQTSLACSADQPSNKTLGWNDNWEDKAGVDFLIERMFLSQYFVHFTFINNVFWLINRRAYIVDHLV